MLSQDKRKKKRSQNRFSLCNFFPKKRKGVSIMIGYVLLVTTAIAMSVIVYAWLKSYVPTEEIACSEGVSIFVKSYTYNCQTQTLTVILKNNGRFSLTGYMIYATTKQGQELATQNLSSYYNYYVFDPPQIRFYRSANSQNPPPATNIFPPETGEAQEVFNLNNLNCGTCGAGSPRIYSIEIVPTRYETINGKNRLATCSDAKVKQEIKCTN